MPPVIRPLSVSEYPRIAEIDVSEEDDSRYQYRDGKLILVPGPWRRPVNTEEQWLAELETWQKNLQWDVMLGAFVGESLAGMSSIRFRLAPDTAQLATLYISRAYRRQGIASLLTDEIIRLATESGARRLYVSAIPSRSAVGFYLKHGFVPTEEPHPYLFELEPDDIHMVRPLQGADVQRATSQS